MSDPFETFIEAQLQQHLGPLVGSAVAPSAGRFAAAAVGAGLSASAGSGLLAALTTKTAAGLAAIGLVAGGGGAVAATLATGSPDPAVWTRSVQAVVVTCKADLGPRDGIGHCVSEIASGSHPGATADPGATSAPATPAAHAAAPSHPRGTPSTHASTPTPTPHDGGKGQGGDGGGDKKGGKVPEQGFQGDREESSTYPAPTPTS